MKRAKILSASAGSGKTYQLALKYICDIIKHPDSYRNILAVTFTNKATEEMKSRILREIHQLASGGKSPYVESICSTLSLSEDKVRQRALTARTKILHNYSRFSVLTIDRFFQRILRAFIKELSLDLNYNIELDTNLLLERSADSLIESIAENSEIREWLLEFASERLDEGSRWDMRGDLCSLGSELFKERGAKRMKGGITKERLRALISNMTKLCEVRKQKIRDLASRAIDTMRSNGVEASAFKGGSRSFAYSFYTYANGELKEPTSTMLKAAEDIEAWYKKGASGNVIATAETLRPILAEICKLYKDSIEHINTTRLLRDNYRSFALLADLQQSINEICDEENIMVLSETKEILSRFIDDSNAPFIYEKVGNRYDHYMIDEFQDTSVREWLNMLPLLREALSSNKEASVFIVGDIKQSIYRWRGGDWRLLNNDAIEDLGRDNTEVIHLQKNYRSLPNIVAFNNGLIERVVARDNDYLNQHLASAVESGKISRQAYETLYDIMKRAYSDHHQEAAIVSDDKGYVSICAFDSATTNSPFIEAIESAIERGYRYRDILILVRNGNDARKVADQLFAYKEEKFTSQGVAGFNILTSDSLTLDGCDITDFIIAVLRLAVSTRNDIERGIYNRFLGNSLDHNFTDEEISWLHHICHLSPMEAFEEIVMHFNLEERRESIAYLQAMHEQVVAFTTSRLADINHFLVWWEERGKSETISVEMTDDTIEITTIHKAKGLERDIVIIPYARWDMSPRASLQPIVWAAADSHSGEAAEIGEFPVIYGSTMQNSAFSEEYYRELVMNHVDGVNLLYVAVTRASKELYMYVPSNLNSKSTSDNITTTAPLIIDATKSICPDGVVTEYEGLKTLVEYSYGEPTRYHSTDRQSSIEESLLRGYHTSRPNIKVRYPAQRHIDEQGAATNRSITAGIRLHSILEKAHTAEQLHSAIEHLAVDCVISSDEATKLKAQIVEMLANPTTSEWFDGSWDDIKCETEIISQGSLRRPDRVMIKGRKAVVVDYKFGQVRRNIYTKQMAEYISLLASMGKYDTIEGYVWYVTLGDVVPVTLD